MIPVRTVAALALALGAVLLFSLATLALFFVVGGPFGALNDWSIGGSGVLAVALVLAIPGSRLGDPFAGGALLPALAVIGAILVIAGAWLVISDTTGFLLAGLVESFGFALFGAWLIALSRSMATSGQWPRLLPTLGYTTGILLMVGLTVGPGDRHGPRRHGHRAMVGLGRLRGLARDLRPASDLVDLARQLRSPRSEGGMNDVDERVSGHYGWPGLMEAIENEIRRNGIEPKDVTVAQLAPVDNYHAFRLAGTLALANAAGIAAADRVLDVGGGIGGPARQLAERFGCKLTVVDLTAEYCAVGKTLTAWTHLTDRVSFVHASALDMPFDDASFDVVWTQHASMNISDKDGLYREVARVVRPGGRFAFFDILAGPNQPIQFPVPWAADPSFSFLVSPSETRALIVSEGFRETTWLSGADLRAELDRSDEPDPGEPESPLDSGLLNGPDSAAMSENVARNLKEGRIVPAIGVFERV